MVNKLALSTSIVIIITLHIYGVNGFIRNCDQETKAEDGTDICQECMSGYYVAANKTACIGCIEGCSKCVDGISCGECTYSFYLNEEKTWVSVLKVAINARMVEPATLAFNPTTSEITPQRRVVSASKAVKRVIIQLLVLIVKKGSWGAVITRSAPHL